MQENFNLKNILKNENFLENAVLILFVAGFIFLKLAQPWGYQISHPHPAYYNANDNFGNGYVYPQYVKETGNFMYEPPYAVAGYKDVVGYYPPLLSHISAMLSISSGIETYDATYLIVTLFSIAAMLLVYSVIRRHSKDLALLSLPFMIGIFNFDFEIARAFGLWIYLTGAMFLTAVVWISGRLDMKYSFIFLALFLTGAALGHTSEFIFSAIFLAFYCLLKYLKEGAPDKPWIKNASFGVLAFLVLSAYYLFIFKNTWMVGVAGFKFEVMDFPAFAPNFGVKMSDFGITLLLMFGGLLIGLKQLAFRKKNEFPFTAIAAGIFILIIGYTNYVGFGVRAWQTRISWPIYFAVFSGIAVYYLGRKLIKDWKFGHAIAISVILIMLFSFVNADGLKAGGIANQDDWNALMWIKNNTPENAKAAYFYGTLSSQPFSLWATGRTPYIVNLDDYIDGAKKGIIKDNYAIAPFSEAANANLSYRKSFFEFGYHLTEDINKTPVRYDEMDYFVLPIAPSSAGNPNVAQYNIAIKDAMLRQNNTKEVYANGAYSVIKKMV